MPKRTGLGAFLVEIFQANEKRPAKKRLIDPQIRKALEKEFGKKNAFLDISNLRNQYNKGRLTGNKKPKIQSHRYNVDGTIMEKHQSYPKDVGPTDGSYKKLSPREKRKVKEQQAKYAAKAKKQNKKAKLAAKPAKAKKFVAKAKPAVFKARKAA